VVLNKWAFVFEKEVTDDRGKELEEYGRHVNNHGGKFLFLWRPWARSFIRVAHI